MMRLLLPILLSINFCFASYILPDSSAIVSLSLKSGNVLWKSPIPNGKVESITFSSDSIIATVLSDKQDSSLKRVFHINYYDGSKSLNSQHFIDSDSARENRSSGESINQVVLENKFKVSLLIGDTNKLITVTPNGKKASHEFDFYPEISAYTDSNVYLTHHGNLYHGMNYGEIFEFSPYTQSIEWYFLPAQYDSTLSSKEYVNIQAIDSALIITANQTVFSFDKNSKKLNWKIHLPKQQIRQWDVPRSKSLRYHDYLVTQLYESIFLIDYYTGRIIWSYKSTPFSYPVPNVVNNMVIFSEFSGEASPTGYSEPPNEKSPDSKIYTVSQSNGLYELISTRKTLVPKGSTPCIYNFCKGTSDPQVSVEVHFFRRGSFVSKCDISNHISDSSLVYVWIPEYTDSATLMVDGQNLNNEMLFQEDKGRNFFDRLLQVFYSE